MDNAFPTLGAAVLYLNGFHHGKHLDRLNYLSRHKPDWVMRVANNMWNKRHYGPLGKSENGQPMREFCAELLDWHLPEFYAETFNEQADKSLDDAWKDALEA